MRLPLVMLMLSAMLGPARAMDVTAAELETLDGVERAANEWLRNHRAASWLAHTGDRLEQAERLPRRPDFERRLGPRGADYLAACRQRDDTAHAEREAQVRRVAQLQRRIGVALAAVALVVAGAGVWIVGQSRAVGRQTSLVLADLARRDAQTNMDRARRLAELSSRDGWLTPAAPEGEGKLAAVAHAVPFIGTLAGHEGHVSAAAFSPDGRRVVTASGDTARVWDVHWPTQHQGEELRTEVCAQKLLGAARIITQADVAAAPILRDREGEDVCPSWWSNFVTRTIAKGLGRK